MNKYIYLKTGENQTFNKRDIFPAGLGRIGKLPKGYVSDYVNGEYFSKLELIFMRESPIAIDRIFFGSGKQGNLNQKNATKSKMGIYFDNKQDITLGYIKKGKSY